MTELNIILDTEFENLDQEIKKNDKEIFYEQLNKELNLYKYNSYSNYKIEFNKIVEDFLYNDNFLEDNDELYNLNIDIKKILIKKLLYFYNPIIKIDTLVNKFLKESKKDKVIIDRNSITLNYPINVLYLLKNKKYVKGILSPNYNILIDGLFNNKSLKYYNNYSNLPYKLDTYKYEKLKYISDLSKRFKQDIYIYLQKLNYNNKSIFELNKVDNNELKSLYFLYLQLIELYLNNNYLNNTIKEENIINLENYEKNKIELVNKEYNKNYITEFNKFLNYKINNNFNNHSYYAFESNDLLSLYEKILIYSIDNKEVKNEINIVKENEINKKIYKENKKIIDEYNLKQIQLEYLTKKKFPNLFNPNSKELLFTKFKTFNFDDLPKKYREIILIEYKKLEKYKIDYIKNKCKHKLLLNKLAFSNNKYPIINEISNLIQNNSVKNDYYKCMICSYNLICPHIIEYYKLLFNKKSDSNGETNEFSIRQQILNKYMTEAKINMIYYCKICGEELGKSLELEQNIEYKDKVKLNTAEYTDETLELIQKNINHIVYTYTTFTEFNLNVTKRYLINYIMNTIITYINEIEKKLRKSKLYNEEKIKDLLNFNSIIFIYANLIFIMSKYPFISFVLRKSKMGSKEKLNPKDIIIKKDSINKKSNIIIPKKVKLESTKDLLTIIKTRFKEAFEIIISSNNILLHKLDYLKNGENIKELLFKTYGIIAKNDQIIINKKEKSDSNTNLLLNSNIYNYLYNIKKIYPLSKNESNKTSTFNFDTILFESKINNIKINDFENILNKTNLENSSNKLDNLFNEFESPIKLDLSKITEIKNYNEYKLISFNLFNYHLLKELYNIPIFELIDNSEIKLNTILDSNYKKSILDNIYYDKLKQMDDSNIDFDNYKNYILLSQLLKKYEINLINSNIRFNLYPYSIIKLNNLRYYREHSINLNIYFCNKDGFPHKYNIYLFKVNKKEVEINKNQLDKFISSLDKKDNLEFIDYKCTKCSQFKNKIYETTKYNNLEIDNLINNINDMEGFFNLYINICPVTTKNNDYQFHNFESNNKNLICSICKINYSDLINKDNKLYNRFNKEYEKYKETRINYFNNKLNNFDIISKNLKETNIKDYYNNKINKNDNKKYIDKIKKLILDNLIIDISKTYKINILYLQNLGLTEGIKYEEINTINEDYKRIDNRINKLNSYLRSLLIYYNILRNNKSVNSYYDYDFNELLIKLKEYNIKLGKELPDLDINISDIIISLKLEFNNKEIIEFYLKAIYNFIKDLEIINKNKFNNKLNEIIDFLLKRVLKFDELFTNFNYSQLKQMFIEDNYDINFVTEENQEYENEDDDELFGYNDLNINFEDEEPIEN